MTRFKKWIPEQEGIVDIWSTERNAMMINKIIYEDGEPISECCAASFGFPGWPDCDFCSACGEHAGPAKEDFDDESTWKNKEESLAYKERRPKK